MYVDVILNIPFSNTDSRFTYSVPDEMITEVEFGKRVIVELGNKTVEGYIIEISGENRAGIHKQVIRIIDQEPVINREMYDLGLWIAEYYACPLSSALAMMLPPILNQTGKISVTEHQPRKSKMGYMYMLNNSAGYDLKGLEKKAPRQAEIMRMMLDMPEISCENLEKEYPISSIRSLLARGFIELIKPEKKISTSSHRLTQEQLQVLQQINQARAANQYSNILLFGVTGSGKTEIYLKAAAQCLTAGRSVLVLVPEIALTRHLLALFSERFDAIAVLHSHMSPAERFNEWKKVRSGEVELVLGTRSAVFAPLKNIGLIIMDEEQETSYKQEEAPRYHAREVARKRAQGEKAVLLLGSATPSLESYHAMADSNPGILVLKQRVNGQQMPDVEIIDMKQWHKSGGNSVLSAALQGKMALAFERGEQSILFINRRGYSPLTTCLECGMMATCPRCSVGMTYHNDINQNVCHYCGYRHSVDLSCRRCGSTHLQQTGYGTQRVEEETRQIFPEARVERLDLDSSRHVGVQKRLLENMKTGKIDILIGTQMVAKGLDFPNVSLVGIINADSILNIPDFRAAERCFQLIVQAAGRAGRGRTRGKVMIQTYSPDNPVIRMAANQDYVAFYLAEMKERRLLNYPPFTKLMRIVVSSEFSKSCEDDIRYLAERIAEMTDASEESIEILGPAPCPTYKIRGKFRYQLLVKCANVLLLSSIGRKIISSAKRKGSRIQVDIDPMISI